MVSEKLNTHQKALNINLDGRWYGSFAEIGAGQEVVRWFFRVGGASGTVAKSMSAYDMAVSDAIYGPADRYVSRPRLQAMLDHEFSLNIERLAAIRGDSTSFFAFANTVAVRSFKGTNECHGWMGVKFQSNPRDEASQLIIHMRMLDSDTQAQQEALGIVGVNLCYGCFFLHHEPEHLVDSLLDGLTTGRIEIDMIEFAGIEFRTVDNRLMALKLVQLGLSGAAMFGPNRDVLQPSEVFHKKAALVERGSFRPLTHVNVDMMRCAVEKFSTDPAVKGIPVVQVMELTMKNLLQTGAMDRRDFLARADILSAAGLTVLVSDYSEFFRLGAYLGRMTKERIGLVLGLPTLLELFNEKYYTELPGGILESFGRLFKNNLKLFVYPARDRETGVITTVETAEVAPELRKLYGYLHERGSFVPLDNLKPEYLSIFSRDVLKKIAERNPEWEQMVPGEVCELIKKRGFFGYIKGPRG
jgi:hypothetical protein